MDLVNKQTLAFLELLKEPIMQRAREKIVPGPLLIRKLLLTCQKLIAAPGDD